ncbi:MAG TPA: TetR/AcrR family transcriptional regulator [Rhodanobacter sp.]
MRTVDPVKHAARREEILAAAERCFATNGFHGATIAQICAEANISPGHLYHYFASKEAIVGAIAGAGLAYVRSRFDELSDELTEDANAVATVIAELERLRVQGRKTGSGVLLDVLAEASRNPAIGKTLQEHSQGMRRLLADFLQDGQSRGEIDPALDADMAAAMLISIIDGSKAMAIRYPELNAKKIATTVEMMITRFLSPP